MNKDKIKITYNEEITDCCPLSEFKTSKKWWRTGGKIGASYCKHPLIKDTELKCDYGISEIKVPEKCPLKEGQLVQKSEENGTLCTIQLLD